MEIPLDYPVGPSVITGVLIRESGSRKDRIWQMTRYYLLALKVEKGATSLGMQTGIG